MVTSRNILYNKGEIGMRVKNVLLRSLRPIWTAYQFADIEKMGNRLYLYINNQLIGTIVGAADSLHVIWTIIKHDKVLWKLSESDHKELTTILREYVKLTLEDED